MSAAKSWVRVTREGEVESRHRVHGVVVGLGGGREVQIGEPALLAFWRSSLKPFQALPVVEEGAADRFGFGPEDLAACAASHAGTQEHVDLVSRMLGRMDVGPGALACGSHRPFDEESARRLERAGEEYSPLHNNCSGKHAGMIARALHAGDPVRGYERPDHPVQRRLRRSLERWLDVDPERLTWGTDGCGVPTPYLSLRQMARAYARLARAAREGGAAGRVVGAMTSEPEIVSGAGRLTTRLLTAGEGRLLAKEGAEGVLCLASPEAGWGASLKVGDGGSRAMGPAAVSLLARLGLVAEDVAGRLEDLGAPAVTNTLDEEVGRIEARLEIHEVQVAGRL